MKTITVEKKDLLEILYDNRRHHREVVEDAWTGYRKEAIKQLEKQLDRAKKGLKKNFYVGLTMPVDHTEDYDRAIHMLEMDINTQVELTEQEFAEYVQDDWGWRGQWATTNSAYTSLAVD